MRQLAWSQIPPRSDRDAFDADRADPHPAERLDHDSGVFHHPANQVINPLVNDDLEDIALAGLAFDPELFRDDPLAFDVDAIPHLLHRDIAWSGQSEDLILLPEAVPGVHDPIRDVAIVREEQQSFGVPIEAPDRVDTLRHLDKLHYRAAVSLVAECRDEARRFVQGYDAGPLGAEDLSVDPDFGLDGIDSGAKLGDDGAVDLDTSGGDEGFGRSA